jgi:hypothetical protein
MGSYKELEKSISVVKINEGRGKKGISGLSEVLVQLNIEYLVRCWNTAKAYFLVFEHL